MVVGTITYLTLILGELVPKRLALNGPETVASCVAGPMRLVLAGTQRPGAVHAHHTPSRASVP